MSGKLLEMLSYIPGDCLQAQIAKGIRSLEGHGIKTVSPVHSTCNAGCLSGRTVMLLFSGIAVLVSPRLSCNPQFAATLLTSFVCHFGEIYGFGPSSR